MYDLLYSYCFPSITCQVMLTGPRGAGKTTILYKWKYNEILPVITATVGYNREDILHHGYNFSIWDISGSKNPNSSTFLEIQYMLINIDVIIYVIDPSDRSHLRPGEPYGINKELERFMLTCYSSHCPFLIVANKCDVTDGDSVSLEELIAMIDIPKLQRMNSQSNSPTLRDIRVIMSSIHDDDSLTHILDTMVDMMANRQT